MPTLITRLAEYRVFEALGEPCGVMVADPQANEAAFRFRRDWQDFAGHEAEVLAAIAADLPEKARELGVRAFLQWVDADLSNTFRCGEPRTTLALDLERTAQTLFARAVRSTAKPYQTHLPVRCVAAAGPLLDNPETDREEWVDVDLRLSRDHFLARIRGHSMEPEIPDGSVCLFRRYAGGSRVGKIMLLHQFTDEGGLGRFSVKRYLSRKRESAEGWEHEQIRRHSENPDFSEWDLAEEGRYETIGEFVRVIADPELEP